MKLSKFTVILAVLLISIMAIGAVSAESVDDSGAIAIDDGGEVQESIADDVGDLGTADTADLTVEDDGGAVLGDEPASYDINDTSYSTYFNEDGTAKETLSADGDYTLVIDTLTGKDIKIISGSSINIIGKEGSGLINNGTIFIGDGTGLAGSITISGLTFTNTNKNAVDISDLSSKITVKGNNINIVGTPKEGDEYFSVYGVNANGFISGLNIEDNNISVSGNSPYLYGIQVGSYAAIANPEDILVSGNKIDLDISEGANMGEAIYLDNPNRAIVMKNNVTVKTVGNVFAYGIQVADSAAWTMWEPGYEGELTSARNVLITENNFNIDSEYMIYAITVIDSGTDCLEYSLCSFGLNVTISNNTVVAKSTRGVMGIVGQAYDMIVIDNKVNATGGSSEGIAENDALGVGTYALGVQYNGYGAEEKYDVIVTNNIVYTNVTGQYLNSEIYSTNVTFDNTIFCIVNETSFDYYFDENGNLKDFVSEGTTLLLGDLTNKNMVIGTPVIIKPLAEDSSLINSTISLVAGADGTSISGLDMVYEDAGSAIFAIIAVNDGVSNVVIENNKITTTSASSWNYNMAISVYGAPIGSKNITIRGNNISMTGDAGGLYGIDVQNYDPFWNKGQGTTGLTISGNIITISGSAMVEPIYVANCNDVLIDGNVLTSTSTAADAYGIGAPSDKDCTITNNKIEVLSVNNMAYGISNTKSEDVVIKNNNISAKGVGAIGVGLSQDANVEVSDNEVAIDGGDYNTITTFDSVGTGNGAIIVREDNTNVKTSGNDITEVSAIRFDTVIEVSDLTVTAAPSGNGSLQITLRTIGGTLLANQVVKVVFNNEVFELTTDENGVAVLPFALNKAGTYFVEVFYLGDESYKGSDASAKITINKIATKTTSAAKTYLATAKTKSFTATLKDAKGNPLAKKTVTFTVNGKTYKATTNTNGVATVKLALTAAKTYTVSIKFAGDSVYGASTVSAKVKLNKEKTKITAPKKTFKRTAKTKKVVITLKNSKNKAVAGKKITLTVNKKKYTVKTNKKGQATFKVKLTKKGTFKYTVKFAGDSQYKAVTKKTGKIVIK